MLRRKGEGMLPGLMRNLVKYLAMLLLLLPVNSFSLGLGEINLHSALNQPLDAEIGLLSIGNTNVEDITVKLASKEDFDKAGIERTFFLTKFTFEVSKRKNGEPYLKITSREPVKEPFLDFIINASWPNGRILREYTLLLDPPVLVDERPAALDIPLFEDELSSTPPQESTTAESVATGNRVKVAPRRDISPFMPRTSKVSRSESGEISYGPVKRTDTLWSISSRMRPDSSVTVQQVMIALLKENPEAFDNQNINELKAGYFLRISDVATISEVSAGEAEQIAKSHYEQWIDAKHSMALAAGQRPLGISGNATTAGGADNGKARLKLIAPDEGVSQSGSGSALGTSGGDIQQELVFALESADISRQENEELRKQLSILEEQLDSMQRLITLKDDTLAVMQIAPEALASGEEALEDLALLPDAVELVEAADQDGSSSMVGPMVVSSDMPQAESAIESPKVTPPAVVVPPPPPVESSIVDDVFAVADGLLGEIDPVIVLGGVAVIGLLAGVLAMRRRKLAALLAEDETEYTLPVSSVDVGEAETAAVSDEAVESVLNDVIPEYSSSGGMDVSDDDEIDAIAEADVYLAYRRFDKAEELLTEAVQHDPERHELQLKLLEVYATSENRDAFIERAETLRSSLGGTDNNIWKSVITMGQKIAPSNPLFSDDDSAVDSDGLDVELPDLEEDLGLDNLDLQIDSSASTSAEPKSESDNPFADVDADSDELEFNDAFDALDDLGELEASLDSAMDLVSEGASEVLPDLDLNEGSKENESELSFEETDSDTDDNSLDFPESDHLTLEETAETVSSTNDEPVAGDELEFEEELSLSAAEAPDEHSDNLRTELSLDDGIATEKEQPVEAAADVATIADDTKEDLVAGVDAEGSSSSAAGDDDWLSDLSDDIDSLDGDLGDLDESELFSPEDEVGTKLDLARAYIDMGDSESAKGILDEVVTDGNDEQKKDAHELIENIS